MKEYEKLAEAYIMELKDACYPYTGDDILTAYQTGFLKARESDLHNIRQITQQLKIEFYTMCALVSSVESLGEKEV